MIPRRTDVYYRYKIPNIVTVQIDTRERIPMKFPTMIWVGHPERTYGKGLPIAVEEEMIALPYGDYRLREYPGHAIMERKASQLEIWKNMNESHDRIRQAKAFRKLSSSCKFPFLLLESSPGELLQQNNQVKNPEIVCHRLGLALAKYNLRLLVVPWKGRSAAVRRKVGTFMLHIMLSCVLQETYDVPPVLIEEE